MKNTIEKLIICIAIPLAVGALAALLIKDSIPLYAAMPKPPLAPPGWLFPIVWTILYILMGISSYLIFISDSPYRQNALILYGLQLVLNFIWPLIFFNMQNYLVALIVLVLLWIAVFKMIQKFYTISPVAAKLQIPYLIWLTFAAYLNLAIYLA